jgi:AraC-like DNA-binding protein
VNVTSLQPGEKLAAVIREFTIVETGPDEEATRVLMPDSGVIVGFRFGGSATLLENDQSTQMPGVTLAGLRSTARRMRTSPAGRMILAVFRATGASQFFPQPLHELFGRTAALDDLVRHSAAEETQTRIAEAADHSERAAIFEEFLLGRQIDRGPDPAVLAAVRAIRLAHGALRIHRLARHLGISQNALERRFRRIVGASPKQYASILRLRHAVKLHRAGASFTEASIGAGYFDQAHWNRDFKSVTGAPPHDFFNRVEAC